MKKIILEFPKQFKRGLKTAEKIKPKGIFEKAIICGLGGSALPADLIEMLSLELGLKVPIIIHRNYGLPFSADKKSLIVCLSYSGNTEEVLSGFAEAIDKKFPLASISSGGKLLKVCREKNIPAARIPQGFQPRMALGFQFSALAKILINCRLINSVEKDLLGLEKELNPRSLENQAKSLAKNLKGKMPIIYSSDSYRALSKIWKIKFNENSKTPAFSNCFPELNHNEMVGFTKIKSTANLLKKMHLIIIKEELENPRIIKRMELTSNLLKSKGIKTDFVLLEGKTKIIKTFSNIILSDWVSYYLAKENKIDPIPVKIVEDFKNKMSKNQNKND